MAKGFKTGGRQAGTPNKTTAELRASIAAAGETPLEYMIRVMRDPECDLMRRDDMARAAAPYLHARLSNVDYTGEISHPFAIVPEQDETSAEWEKGNPTIPTSH